MSVRSEEEANRDGFGRPKSGGPGWWLASDGRWYPPETAPAPQAAPARQSGPQPTYQQPAAAPANGRHHNAPQPNGQRPLANGEPGTEAIISLRGVTKSFGSHTVLEDITFDVPKGHITCILGPSGTGKSVLLKNIIGLLRPDKGEIWVDGEQTVGMGERDQYRVRRKFGVLFQDGALFGSMNLFDNIAFPLREHTKKSDREIREIVIEKAGLVGLLDHMKKTPGEVSGGMKKRAGLARALAMDPEIVFFDEPDSGLDPVRVAYLDELTKDVQQKTGATFFIITHNIPSVMRTAEYMGILFRSGLVKFASKEQMKIDDNPIIRQFLAGRARGPIGMDEMATEDNTDWESEPVDPKDNEIMTV